MSANNESEFWHDRTALKELMKCFGSAPEDMVLTPPVYFDHGDRFRIRGYKGYTESCHCGR